MRGSRDWTRISFMRVNIRLKTVILLVFFALILSGTALSVSTSIINRIIEEHCTEHADELAASLALYVDGDLAMALRRDVMEIYDSLDRSQRFGNEYMGSPEFNAYIERYREAAVSENTEALKKQLATFEKVNNVDCMYLVWVVPEDEAAVYLVDADPVDPCPTGNFDHYSEFLDDMDFDPERGFPAYASDTEEYGWLITAGAPVRDSKGEIAAYATLDVNMQEVRDTQRSYILLNGSLLLGLTVIMILTGLFFVNHYIVKPLHILSSAAKNYCRDSRDSRNSLHHGFEALQLRNHDEIGDLYDSMKQMESDMNDYYTNLYAAKQEIIATREEADRMNELANADALTGVRNKRSYDLETQKLEEQRKKKDIEFAIAIIDLNYLKQINDRYGHEMGDLAIRKICDIICDIFEHSPVFRYGGDEFVVILKDRDLLHADELRKRFLDQLETLSENTSLKPWEKVSAAIGIARFVPGRDRTVEDTFRHADEEMYRMKKEMKTDKIGM